MKTEMKQEARGPIEAAIAEKLAAAFAPTHLQVKNDSRKHAGHLSPEEGNETHFAVMIASSAFAGKSRIERHRMVNDALAAEFAAGLHALSIKAEAK